MKARAVRASVRRGLASDNVYVLDRIPRSLSAAVPRLALIHAASVQAHAWSGDLTSVRKQGAGDQRKTSHGRAGSTSGSAVSFTKAFRMAQCSEFGVVRAVLPTRSQPSPSKARKKGWS